MLLFLLACASPDAADTGAGAGSVADPDPVEPWGNVRIEQLYYSGSSAEAADHYYSDQFVELANVGAAPVMLGGLYLGNAYGVAGEINPGMEPDSLAVDDPDNVYLENVWRIPGDPADVVLGAGESVIIAHDGTNHAPFSPLDLSGADWESYVDEYGEDTDSPTVENLESVHYTGGYDWLITVFGPSVVVFSDDSGLELHEHGSYDLMRVPAGSIIDGIDCVMDADSGDYKRLPGRVDAGFTYVSGTYTGESVRRLQDTDDSTVDFEVVAPPVPG